MCGRKQTSHEVSLLIFEPLSRKFPLLAKTVVVANNTTFAKVSLYHSVIQLKYSAFLVNCVYVGVKNSKF